jgi:hypothetical protein
MSQFKAGGYIMPMALLLFLSMMATSWAVSTSYWEVQRQEQFDQGIIDSVSIHSDGKVTLGPAVDLLADIGESFVWCLAVTPTGDLFAGTGNNGKIIKLMPDGQEMLWHDSEELEILSLIMGQDGHLYAGTSPDGNILRITPQGHGDLFFDTGEKHVWSLAFDDDGNLYGGTGIEGKIFKIPPDGRGELFYDTDETNVTTLVWHEKHLYAGGSGSGLIYRLDRQGQGMMLFDAEEEEICNLVFDAEGRLYAAATSVERPIGRPPAPEKLQQQEEAPEENSQNANMFIEEPVQMGEFGLQVSGPSTIYQIDGYGSGQPLWRAPEEDMIFSMERGANGDLIVGTGDQGRIYSVSSAGDWSLLTELEESQILALTGIGRDGLLVGTGNIGMVYRLGSDYAQQGTLESEVYDATVVSRWGRLSWEANTSSGTRVHLQTRSGNSEIPDETWSPWSERYGQSEGESIHSPPARFIQWRANLSTSQPERTPTLEKVWLAYIQNNLPPRIQGLFVHPVGSGNESGQASSGRQGGKSGFGEGGPSNSGDPFGVAGELATGIRKASWHAYDPNGDALEFDLFFKGQEEHNWKLLKDELSSNSYSWDSNLFPDGIYRLKVVVSDRLDNPDQEALGSEKISDPFVVDNTAPQVEVEGKRKEEGRYQVTGRIKDALSPIVELWYSLDADDWKPLTVSDGVFDSLHEEFSFFTEPLSLGEHTIVVRSMDMAGNVGVGKAVIQ